MGNECIRIVGTKNTSNSNAPVTAESRTMTLLTYGAYSKVYVLGTAAAFQSSTSSLDFTVTLTYTDGTTSRTTYTLYDWYGNPTQTEGYASYRRDDGYRGSYGNPILQSKAIGCDDTKLLKSITFAINAKSSVVNDKGYIYAGIYAVTGAVSADAPDSPSAVSATEVGEDSFTAKWNEVSGANGYVIDVSEYKDFRDANGNPSFVGEYNNFSVSEGSTTSLEISGLDKKKTYYYRVRSKNNAGQSLNSNVMSVTTVEHIHSWQYKVNGNVIKAYCNGSIATCNHQGEDKAVYLTLKFTGLDENNSTTYSGNAFNGASVENNITSVTGETASYIKYKGRGETSYEESTTAPTDVGTYTAEVTIAGVTATADFMITPKSIKDAVISLTSGDVIHTGNEITQAISSVKVAGINSALMKGTDYEVAKSSTLKAKDFGTYMVTINGVGNYKDTASVKWKIKDENPPTGEITIAEKKWTDFSNSITFGHFFKGTQKVTIDASDIGSGVDKVYYYNSNEALQEDAVKALADDKWTEIANGGSYNIDAENNYVVYAKITDKSGNETYISSNGFAIDKTAPKITGVENGKTYCIEKEITITDSNLDADKVTVNGEKITLTDGKYTIKADTKDDAPELQKYTISAEDKAGNKTELTITLRKSHNEVPYKDVEATCTKDGHTGGSYCSVCGKEIKVPTNTKLALGHDMPVDWTIEKEATADEEGLQSKTCQRKGCGYKMYQSIPVIGTTDIGSLDKYAEVAPDALVKKALFDNKKDDVLSGDSKIFTTAQKAQIKDSNADAKVWLEISKTDEEKILPDEKSEIQKKAVDNVGNGAKVSYFDADLFAQVGNADKQKVPEPGIDIEVKITIPNDLLNHNSSMVRDYKIIRLHKDGTEAGTVDVLDGVFNSATKELTFKTNRFSTYAIAYNDRYIGGGSSGGSSGGSTGGSSGSLWTPAPETTVTPSVTPTAKPEESTAPSTEPTTKPSTEPTTKPSVKPTTKPSVKPTATPTVKPSVRPVISKEEKEKNGLSLNEKLKVDQNGSKITVSWGKVKGVDGYKVYAQYCGKKFTEKSCIDIKNGGKDSTFIKKINGKKLNLKKNYKLYVEAYKLVKGKEVSLGRTITAHVVGAKNDKETNVKAVKLAKTSYKLSVGKKVTIKGSTVLVDKTKKPLSDGHAKELRFATSNSKVAQVSEKGVIKAVGKGTCTIYVYARNGHTRKIKITVK